MLVLFSYLAGVAPKLELVSAVIILPQRQTALVAKRAAEIDVLTFAPPGSTRCPGGDRSRSATPDQVRTLVEEWRGLGATHLSLNTVGANLHGPDAHIQRLTALSAILRD